MIKLLMNIRTDEKRIAVLEKEQLVEFIIEQPGRQVFVGDIIKGRVVKVVPGLQAVFIELGSDKTGYLPKHELSAYTALSEDERKKKSISGLITEGSEVIVQILKESFGSKGPKLTEQISLPGRKIVYTPNVEHIGVSRKIEESKRERLRLLGESLCTNGEGVIIRTSAENMDASELEEELVRLRKKWAIIYEKSKKSHCPSMLYQESGIVERTIRDFGMRGDMEEIIVDERNAYLELLRITKEQYPLIQNKLKFYKEKRDLFSSYQLDTEIKKALQTRVWLKNGAFLVIEKTEAMTVIDVNTGKYTGKQNQAETVLQTNKMAAIEIAKQIRLRNLSGMIIIDFISMSEPVELKTVEGILQNALEKDRNKVHTFGFTNLGLYQLTRKKMREPITVELMADCPTCHGTGMVYTVHSIMYQIEREIAQYQHGTIEAIWLETSIRVFEFFQDDDMKMLHKWKEQYGIEIYITSHDRRNNQYTIRDMGEKTEVYKRFLQGN